MDQITVIIPTYNRCRLVKRAIESVLAQTHSPAQIIVVDDGSKDDTAMVCREFGRRIEYMYQPNAGVSAARNLGIRLARHPWTAFLDSDDYWTPTHLASMAAACDATDGQALLYFTDMVQPDEAGQQSTLWERIGFRFSEPFLLKDDGVDWVLSHREPISIQSSMFQTEVLRFSGGFNPRYRVSEDRELFFRLGIGGKLCAVNTVGCIQTADENPAHRLGGIVHTRSMSYWEHEHNLWSETLERFPWLDAAHRRAMRYGIALAQWRLTRLHWHAGDFDRCYWSFLTSLLSRPAFYFWLLFYGRAGAEGEKVLPPCRPE